MFFVLFPRNFDILLSLSQIKTGIYSMSLFSLNSIFPTQCRLLATIKKRSWKHCGKRRKSSNQHFLICPQCFLPLLKEISIFQSHLSSLQMLQFGTILMPMKKSFGKHCGNRRKMVINQKFLLYYNVFNPVRDKFKGFFSNICFLQLLSVKTRLFLNL